VTRIREPRKDRDEPQSLKGSTRLEAKKQRRREGREAGRRRTIITEAEFLARRESVERVMVVRNTQARTQIGVLEDGVLVEHYVSRETNASMAGNVYLGRVQNVLPSMEAAFVDIGKGRNAVLYAGEVNWDAAGLEGNQPRRIENALSSGDSVLVQVTKDPIGHKGARLTSQISLPGRYLVYVPEGHMTGISRKLPDTERARLKQILKEVVPDSAGVIVRTAAEGASEEELRADVERLTRTWEKIQQKAKSAGKGKGSNAPVLVHGEPDLTVRVIRDVFNEDFTSLVVAGQQAWDQVSDYIGDVAPDLAGRLSRWTSEEDLFTHHRVDEQIAKAMDRKVWLPSGGSLVIDRTEAMTVIDVNTGKFVGSGGNLEETVTKNNVEAAEEIVRQLRLRDIGGIIVIDFIDMVLESNRDLVVRRLLECLGRDRTKHQVAEVTSLGLVQMTRKRVGSGLIEVFSEPCEHCHGRGFIIHAEPVDRPAGDGGDGASRGGRSRRGKSGGSPSRQPEQPQPAQPQPTPSGPTPAQIAAAAHAAALKSSGGEHGTDTDEHPAPGMPEAVAQGGQGDHDREATVLDAVEPAGVAEPRDPEAADAVEPADAAEAARGGGQAAYGTEQPAPRRRKRGRVVAPAGPPRGSAPAGTVVTLPAGASEEE
jgi:ribonuclease E